jgi:hypothetical protein
MKREVVFVVIALALSGCMPAYTLVRAEPTSVADNALIVQPSSAWNVVPTSRNETQWEETWTRNGPLLETVTFMGGVPDGKAVIVQRKKDDQQVSVFRADMTAQDLVSMLEASYRVRGVSVFEIESVDPVDFLGGKGLKVRYKYAPNNGISKKGACIARVVDKKLYFMKLEGVSSHYFDAAMPEFDHMVATAELR